MEQFANIVWKEGQYAVVQCLNIEVSCFSDTKEDGLKNPKEAIKLYMGLLYG